MKPLYNKINYINKPGTKHTNKDLYNYPKFNKITINIIP